MSPREKDTNPDFLNRQRTGGANIANGRNQPTAPRVVVLVVAVVVVTDTASTASHDAYNHGSCILLLYWVLSTTPLRLALRGSPRINQRISRISHDVLNSGFLRARQPPLNRTHDAYSPFREIRAGPLYCMRLSAWVPQRGHPESPIGSGKQGFWVTTADSVDLRCATHCGSEQNWTFSGPSKSMAPDVG